MKYYLILLVSVFINTLVHSQKELNVVILSDASKSGTHQFEQSINTEISSLLRPEYNLSVDIVHTDGVAATIEKELEKLYSEMKADVIVGAGLITSEILSKRKNYSIPTIASIKLASPDKPNGEIENSSINNFNYIESPFGIASGLDALKSICKCASIAILVDPKIIQADLSIRDILPNMDEDIMWLNLDNDLTMTIDRLPKDTEAVYILSTLLDYRPQEIKHFFTGLNAANLPSFSLLDKPMIAAGAYASFATTGNLTIIPRRIALNIEKISDGINPSSLPIQMETFSSQLVINMQTANEIQLYPEWSILDNALLQKINRPKSERILNLKSAIAEGIQNNLDYKIEVQQSHIGSLEVDLAKSNYKPQLNLESTGFFLDQNTVNSSFGTLGSFNWTAGASFSQLILSEPALANIAIQNLLFESQKEKQNQTELDVILEVAQRYFSYMQIRTQADLQNSNIASINQNLTIARNKEKIGYSGASDAYRWQTELEIAKADLNTTNANLKAVSYQLNETLNRPISEVFSIEESHNIDQLLAQLDEFLVPLIKDEKSLNVFADFMVNEAFSNLPEIRQIELALAAQQRLLISNKRSFYLPTIAFGAGIDYNIKNFNVGDSPSIPGFEINNDPTWNAAFNVSIPIFTGGDRKYQQQKSQVEVYQLHDQRKNLKNNLEIQLRSNLQQVNASYNNIRLTQNAATAAESNIAIVQDLYKSGVVEVITLIDAQNSLLGANTNAANAVYQFMLDYFVLQRSTGSYSFFYTEDQRGEFLDRFLNFKNNE